MRPLKFGIGQPHVRIEDPALLTGRGRFLADCIPMGALRAVVVRSPHAHARFRIRNLDGLRGRAGVRLVLAAADIAGYGTMPCGGLITPSDEKRMWRPPLPLLVSDEVRHVGDAVAFIVADTLTAALDAAEALEIEWEALPAIVDTKAAVAPGAPLVWSERPGNLSYTAEIGDRAAAVRAFERAEKVVKIEVVNQRLVTNYMETRGALAEPAAGGRPLTLTVSTQGSHAVRDAICDKVLKIARAELRVITPDVGGGFGTKLGPYREYALALIAAKKLERAVAWVADRSEHFIGDSQGRDNVTIAEMALDPGGRFLAMRVDTIANLGAYLSYYAPFIPWNGASMLPGSYVIPALHARVRAVYTHTVPVDAYRGAGRPEATYVIERLVDAVARETGVTPEEVRRKNFIPPEAMPYKTATGRSYDSGEFAGHLDRAKALADWNGFTLRAKDSERRGRVRGIGLSSYIEACGGGSEEVAKLRLERDGSVTLYIGTQSNGQGHKTAYAQIIAGELDLPLDLIRVVQGDTAEIATGGGTGGSRSLPTGGVSVRGAARKLAVNLKNLAAAELDARPDELEIAAGGVRVPGTNRAISLTALAAKHDADEHLVAEDTYAPSTGTYPNGSHICEVEIDPATGRVSITRYTVVDDFGATINPLLLEGQVQGGVAQGIGQALLERAVYDETGQLVTASLMDYALPRADDLPFFAFETRNVPCKTNPLGLKGAGEAGAIGSTPAVMNAVIDALDRGFGIKHLDMPATPERVWRAIEKAKRSRR